ncbi:hypothetical protein HPB47_023485, partial [Ixodes persulcatus]
MSHGPIPTAANQLFEAGLRPHVRRLPGSFRRPFPEVKNSGVQWSHYHRHSSVAAASESGYDISPSTPGLRDIIRDIVREELKKLLPTAERPASISIAEVVRDEVQRAFLPDAPVTVAAPEEPTLTYAAATRRPPPPAHPYRAPPRQVIGALTSVIMIWAVTGVLVYMAILRMINKEYNIQADIMLISATVGVIVNIIMGLALQIHPPRPFGHSHTSEDSARPTEITTTEPFVPCHPNVDSSPESPCSPELLGPEWIPPFAHSRAAKRPVERSGTEAPPERHNGVMNLNVRAAFIHVLGDLIQSVGVLLAAIVIYFC